MNDPISDVDNPRHDVSGGPVAIPLIVVIYHSVFFVLALFSLIGSLLALVFEPLNTTALWTPPIALACTLITGSTAWGIAHGLPAAVRWSRRLHLLIATLGAVGALITLCMVFELAFGKDYYGRNWRIYAVIVVCILAMGAGGPSWACYRLLRETPPRP